MRVYIDTMMFIYWFDHDSPFFLGSDRLFKVVVDRHTLILSLFLKAELMVHPTRHQDQFSVAKINRLFSSNAMKIVSFDDAGVREFAQLRAHSSIKPVDALHLALASAHGTNLFVTNDRQLLGAKLSMGARIVGMEEAMELL